MLTHNKLFVDYVESEGLKPLLDIIENIGDWPMTSDSWKEEEFNWEKAIAELNRHLGLSPLVSLIVYSDRRNSTQNVITVSDIFRQKNSRTCYKITSLISSCFLNVLVIP